MSWCYWVFYQEHVVGEPFDEKGAPMKMPLDDPSFVKEDKEYLLDKGGGGKDNRRGYQYEMRYGAWEQIKLAYRVRQGLFDPFKVSITSQMQCYIDDLVVEEGDVARYFEMKAAATITWGDPECEHTMSWNFKRQKAFDDRHQQKAEYHLVLANPDRQRVLGGKAPEGISVIGFPFTNTISEIAASI